MVWDIRPVVNWRSLTEEPCCTDQAGPSTTAGMKQDARECCAHSWSTHGKARLASPVPRQPM